MTNLLATLHATVWNEHFWLHKDSTWGDIVNTGKPPIHPEFRDLLIVIPLSLLLTLTRHLVERFICTPLAPRLGIPISKKRALPYQPKLEEFYQTKSRQPDKQQLSELASVLCWPQRRVERWFRIKQQNSKCTPLKKFRETAWRLVFYTLLFVYGLYVLHDEVFITDARKALELSTWPHHHLKTEFYWYYMLELSFYTSLLLSLSTDVRRSDFYEQLVHHILTITVMIFSYIANFVRIGLLVLILHDMADPLLELTKIFDQTKSRLVLIGFVVFSIVWLGTRLVVFPVYVVGVCWHEYLVHPSPWPAALVMIVCLSLLQVLHVIWTGFLVRAVVRLVVKGEVKDTRGQSSELSSDPDLCDTNGNPSSNGSPEKLHQS